ncbi:MAG: acetyl-CoA acetyltransferase [SAR324 cluster bacterium]|nr:acetyl-CoA acetyltransferase [SAR324 cluster bacterium]
MSDKRQPVIAAVADTPLEDGKAAAGATVLQIQARAAQQALAEAGLTLQDVDGLLVSGTWGMPGPGQMMALTVAEYLGLQPRLLDGTNIGGSSFNAFVAHAAMAVRSGYCDTALILYGSTQRSESSRTLGGRPPVLNMQWETPWGLPTPVGSYAMAAMRHMHEYGTTSEHLAEIAVSTRAWAALNPAATKRDPITIEDVLNSTMICDPLHLFDCCLVTDGGGAVVITTAERAADLKRKPVLIRGYGESMSHANISSMPDLTVTAAAVSGKAAMEMAGVTHDEIDVVEIYDSFTVTVLLTLESLGFCKRGEGGAFVTGQRTAPGGDFPLNTNGGGLSYAHPGMYGIFTVIEAARQLWGECGDRQIPNAKLALAHGTGGVLSSTATVILSRE